MSHNTVYKAMKGKKIRIDSVKRIIRHSRRKLTLDDFGY